MVPKLKICYVTPQEGIPDHLKEIEKLPIPIFILNNFNELKVKHSNLQTYSSFSVTLAAAIPKLDLFISLVGAMSSSTLALMAPPIIDTVTNWEKFSAWRVIRNLFLFTLGFLGFLTGTFVSLKNIVHYFASL